MKPQNCRRCACLSVCEIVDKAFGSHDTRSFRFLLSSSAASVFNLHAYAYEKMDAAGRCVWIVIAKYLGEGCKYFVEKKVEDEA
jgi:hypothetical protein